MEKADFGRRLSAFIFDGVLWLVIWWAALIVFSTLAGRGARKDFVEVAVGLAKAAYYIWLQGATGRTLGKRIAGIVVRDKNGTRIGYTHAVIRYLPYLITTLGIIVSLPGGGSSEGVFNLAFVVVFGLTGLFGAVDAICLIVNPDHRAVHDLMAGTTVVKS